MSDKQHSWQSRAERVIYPTDAADFERGYDEWAPDYDLDHVNFGTLLLVHFAAQFCRHVPVTASPILDAGAGTGRMAEALTLHGYHHFTGVDLSAGMLEVAAAKGVYQEVRQMRLGAAMDFPSDYFEVVASLAAMSPNHIGAETFDELVRITKPGGKLVLSMRSSLEEMVDYDRKREALVQAGAWRLIDCVEDFVSHPELQPPLRYSVYVYEAL